MNLEKRRAVGEVVGQRALRRLRQIGETKWFRFRKGKLASIKRGKKRGETRNDDPRERRGTRESRECVGR